FPKALCPRQGGAQLVRGKARYARGFFTGLEDHASDALPGPGWMNEESTNLGRVTQWVQQGVLTPSPMVAAVERPALAPAAAADNRPLCSRVQVLRAFLCA